ncbi:YhcB family protein [Aestuariirhabdus sp. LZHN29]|uniref:YhcB family protein n=1 Tax=Aestuariirhabdus sp. LZHN29 TaxID=3417462 RepID=UPI003CF68BA3
MEDTNNLWVLGSTAFIGGILAGVLLYHMLRGGSPQNNRVEEQLRTMESQFKDYQDKVSDHFSTTAHLVSKLTESYKDVHEHLAASSEHLCTDEVTRHRLSDSLLSSSTLLSETDSDGSPRPPLDYSNSKGTLSEEFGVKKKDLSESQEIKASQA